ncbi:MAG TPA: hypothetical protein VN281_00690 [Verrucomicrobiae bacterium]|nr:hypothetical protein [Verrucomicrobiae bacterium]
MKPTIARISLVAACIFFFVGFSILCTCPGWFALATVFAGVAAWTGTGRLKLWSVIWLIACLIATVAETANKIEEYRKFNEWNKTHERDDPKSSNPTPH